MSRFRSRPTGIVDCRMDWDSPVLALSLHSCNQIREDIREKAADAALRLWEEDPGTDRFANAFPVAMVVRASRFETDLNRPPELAVYQRPEHCWNIEPYNPPLSHEQLQASLARYREGIAFIDQQVDRAVERFGYCVLLDFHSYNYQRKVQVSRWWEDPRRPVFNLGTGKTDPSFRPVLDALLRAFSGIQWEGRAVTVGENQAFDGGYIHFREEARHPGKVLVPSIEVKKVFMEERTGRYFEPGFSRLVEDSCHAIGAVMEMLPQLLPRLGQPPPPVLREAKDDATTSLPGSGMGPA